MTIAYIGLGSNLGDRAGNLRGAADDIDWDIAAVRERSWMYESLPVGSAIHQPKFFNQVIAIEPLMTPHELLARLQDLEQEMGRDREGEERWGPRVIDLDILLWDDEVINTDDLVIPHPRLHERAFVLLPLKDIAPELMVPGRGTVEMLVKELMVTDIDNVKRLEAH